MALFDKPENRRRYARVNPSGLVSKAGTIITDVKAPAVKCMVVDLSAGGACLEVPDPDRLPKRFVLLHGSTKKSCRIVWKRFHRIGVQF
jgi:hypothetical protein